MKGKGKGCVVSKLANSQTRKLADSPRIGIDVTAAVTQGGGIGRYTRELVWALAEADKTTAYHLFHAKMPASPPVPNPLPTAANMRRHPAPLSDRWLYRLWHRLRVPLPVNWFTGPIDLYHFPDFVLPPVRGGVPTLLTVHDLSFIHYPQTFTPALVAYLNRVVPASVARATHILADSQATRADLIDLWQVPETKITVLYSGVSEKFRPVTEKRRLAAVRDRYGLGESPYLLSVGTLQPRKNYQMLVRAFKGVAAQWPHNLYIAGGKGWLYEEMMAEVAAQGLRERVKFLGFVDDADLPTLYSAATLFLFPSLYEGFGLPLLEAMACGVPVVSAATSSLVEVAGQAAWLLPPRDERAWQDTMHRLLLDTPRRTKMVAEGFRQAHRFTWRETARQLLTIYRRLLKRYEV